MKPEPSQEYVNAFNAFYCQFEEHSWERAVLAYLWHYCRGRDNARCWPRIKRDIHGELLDVAKNSFQYRVILPSRSGGQFFICSTDTAPAGYYLPLTEKDMQTMLHYYHQRVEAILQNVVKAERFRDMFLRS